MNFTKTLYTLGACLFVCVILGTSVSAQTKSKKSKKHTKPRPTVITEAEIFRMDHWDGSGRRHWYNDSPNNFSIAIELGDTDALLDATFNLNEENEPYQTETFQIRLQAGKNCTLSGKSVKRWYIRDETGKVADEDFKITDDSDGYKPSERAKVLFKEAWKKWQPPKQHTHIPQQILSCLDK
jgi:hypothetical protein